MNQPTFVPSVLHTKTSEELQKSIAADLSNHSTKTISEMLDEEKEKNTNNIERD